MANTFKFGNGKWYGKKGTIMAYNDENKNYKPLAFDFTRTSTATYVGSDGLIKTAGDGEPRVDYLDNTDGHLLLEPSRTNLLPYSNDFTNGAYSKTRCTVTANQAVSPDGTQNADLMTATDDDARLEDTVGSAGQSTSMSVYVKSATGSDVEGQIDFSGANIVTFTATNEWQRIETTLTTLSISPRFRLRIDNNGDSLYVFGGQVEYGSYATSYIPTEGASVTRTADAASSSVNTDVINSTEGTIYFEGNSLESSFIYNYFITLSDNSQNNRLEIRQSSDDIQFLWRVGGTYQSAITKSNITTDTFKVAVKYSSANIKMYYNGSLVNTISSPTLYSANTLNRVGLDRGIVQSADQLRGKVKNIRIYNTALTDAELITLTT